jgi:hypothetical protein
MINKIRIWIIKKLLKEKDGYINIGIQENTPINFYYDENINKYVLGKRSGNFYYAQLKICGLCYYSSKHLDWNEKHKEPKIVPFNRWIHGVLDQIHQEYMELKSKYIETEE